MRTTFSSCDTSERRLRSQCLSNKAGLYALGKERTDFVGYDDPKGAVAEAFRALRTSHSLSPALSKAKLLAVMSSVPSEGKSFVALNLALTYVRGGKRVLLVNCDMRRRRLTYLLMADKCEMPRLSKLLAGTVTEMVEALTVKPFSDMALTFLPTGLTPPNPVELLGAELARGLWLLIPVLGMLFLQLSPTVFSWWPALADVWARAAQIVDVGPARFAV